MAHSRSNVAASLAAGGLNLTMLAARWRRTTPLLWTWGLYQPAPQGVAQEDVRAVGTALSGTNMLFALNTHNRTSTPSRRQEIDICIDTSGGPGFTPNKILIGINRSALSSSLDPDRLRHGALPDGCQLQHNGRRARFSSTSRSRRTTRRSTAVPRGGTGTTGLGLTAANPRFKYQVFYFGTDGLRRGRCRGSDRSMPSRRR